MLLAFLLFLSAPPDTLPYRLQEPSHIINLASEELKEISGLSATDQPGVFCAIADEKGEIYFVDIQGGGAILRSVLFRDKGDFEGLEWLPECLYAVKSNGDVYEIAKWDTDNPRIRFYDTSLEKADDVEGLGYDSSRKSLLLACKGNPDSDSLRNIFAFSLKSNKLEKDPVYSINPLEVNRLVPYEDGEKQNFFSPSGIAVHPATGDVYVLSSALKRLVVLNRADGAIRFAVRLDKKLLPQPEGITFDKEGNLYLSSEGKKGEGQILRFDFQK
ncbi:MAG: SdiA-regulated domain-containing protein [Saprospiraceae bacterium]|nr:SdiA-regulated domain-containing protein [Saprospiraceae bacterium]